MTNDDYRIDAEEAQRHVFAGQAILVCAYEDPVKCREVEGSISLHELQQRLPRLSKSQEMLFICA